LCYGGSKKRSPALDMSGPNDANATTSSPRVLILLKTEAAFARGVLRSFASAAHGHGWTLLHYHPDANVGWLVKEWAPAAVVVGPALSRQELATFAPLPLISVAFDRSGDGVASVCLDEAAIGLMALEHLLATGLRRFSCFRLSNSPYIIERERAFVAGARAAGAMVSACWGSQEEQRAECPAAILQWLRELPKPCGIFTCTDRWGALVARYARVAGLRIPEDVALVGADNDMLECELIVPPLSSVIIPWHGVGQTAADLVRLALSGTAIAGKRSVLGPIAVAGRRSSDVFAADDPLVTKALRWIRGNAGRRITVEMVARALGGGRQRLERRFRAVLRRTVHEEIRRAHVDIAKGLLETTDLSLAQVAAQSGFTNASLLSVAFRRELGSAPGVYRRRVQRELGRGDSRAPRVE
jgi:LacI family transcriptional regulator, galactose operon repressor